jgi:hypothetical protein
LLQLYSAAALAACAAAHGDIVIEGADADGQISRVTIGADKARIDGAGADMHMLLDLETHRILAVNTRERFAMDLASPRQQRSEHARTSAAGLAPPEVQLADAGTGPDIAGYPTRRYRVLIDGVHCHDEYLASGPLAEPGIRRFIEIMAAASDDQDNRVLTQLTEPERLCEVSDDLVDDHYPQLGIPLRNVALDGAVTHEITRIRLDAPAQPALFELPAEYPLLTRAQVIERMGDSELDSAALAEKQRRIQDRIEEIEGRDGATTEPPAPPP